MKTKLEMAHDYLRDIVSNWEYGDSFDPVAEAWKYADAMQAEADKRTTEVIVSYASKEFHNKLEVLCKKEWQPDWSQAPSGYDWWAMDGFSGVANWYKSEPFLDDDDTDEWNVVLSIATYREAPSFGYTGDWRESLRKRPK